jgi:hypothetical protein
MPHAVNPIAPATSMYATPHGPPVSTPSALSAAALTELTGVADGPCLSLYQPTHRTHPENLQDPIRFRHGMKALHESLQRHPDGAAARALLAPFETLAQDRDFWRHTLDGLAVLAAPGLFRVFVLQRAVAELAVVADSLHTKPLRRLLQTADRYQVLGLSRHHVQLFEGHRDSLAEIALAPGVPRTVAEALGSELTDAHSTRSSYGGVGSVHGGGVHGSGNMAMHHGHGGKKDEVDGDAERFFRAVDRAVIEHHSKPSGLPLILAALPEHHHLFRQVSRNPLLAAVGLMFDPQGMPLPALRERAWQALAPQQHAEQQAWAERLGSAQAQGVGSDDLATVAEAAAAGRVAMLRIESGRQIGGRLNRQTGHIELADLGIPDVDDLLDDLAELVEAMGGEVRVLHADAMPSDTGLAAIFRH